MCGITMAGQPKTSFTECNAVFIDPNEGFGRSRGREEFRALDISVHGLFKRNLLPFLSPSLSLSLPCHFSLPSRPIPILRLDWIRSPFVFRTTTDHRPWPSLRRYILRKMVVSRFACVQSRGLKIANWGSLYCTSYKSDDRR